MGVIISILFWSVSPLVLLMASGELSKETKKEFAVISDAITQAQSCQSLGFSVNRDGLMNWSTEAKGRAVKEGLSEEDAGAMMQNEIDRKYKKMEVTMKKAAEMSHSYDHVQRHNAKLRKGCKKLSKHEKAGLYVIKGE